MFKEGQEYSLEDPKTWGSLVIGRGEIVEVHLPSTNLEGVADVWAGFWIKQVAMLGSGDYYAVAKSLGCSDPSWSRQLSSFFNL